MKIKPIPNNKRGQFTDIFIFIVVAIAITFVSVVVIYAGQTVTTEMHTALDNRSTANVNYTYQIDESMGDVNTSYAILKWISTFLIFGMIIAIFIGSYMVQTRPVFFVPYIIVTIIAVIASAIVANAYESVRGDATLAATFAGMTGPNFIFQYLPVWVSIIGIAGGIVMFTRMDR